MTGRRWPNRTVTLGNPASHSPDDARAEANRIKGQAAAGGDPAAEKKARAADEQRKRGSNAATTAWMTTRVRLPRRPKMRGAGLPSPEYVTDELAHTRQALADMEPRTCPRRT